MEVEIIKNDKIFVKESFIKNAVSFFEKSLSEQKILKREQQNKKLIIAFVSREYMIGLNSRFRNKKSVTDVLSFSPSEEGDLGELALCVPQIKIQADEEKLTLEEELAYLILHGVLHLLGYHHEEGGEPARLMYQIQDSIFEKWQLHHKENL